MLSYMKFGPVVQEMSFEEKVYGRMHEGRQKKTDHDTFGSGELKSSQTTTKA